MRALLAGRHTTFSFDEAKAILTTIASDACLRHSMDKTQQIAKLRAVAINDLVRECAHVFLDNEAEILNATFRHEIIKNFPRT
jgi:dGTPase